MPIRLLRLAGLLGLAGLALASCSPGAAPSSKEQTAERSPSFFYRMTADFILKETGEPIRFDYVVGCGGVTFSNRGTTPTAFITHHPMIMFEPVGDGHVLGLVTIDMCESWKWEPIKHGPDKGKSRIPVDLRPLAIWIDDVNDLSFGWGYKTDDAYDSPLAKIEFVEASVTKTDEAAWQAWRKKAEADYEQVGALPGPWGYNYTHEPFEYQIEANQRGAGFGIVDPVCVAEARIALGAEDIEAALKESDVKQDRFLVFDNPGFLPVRAVSQRYEAKHEVKLSAYSSDFYFLGTLSKNGGGHILPIRGGEEAGYRYRDVFPLMPRSRTMHGLKAPTNVYRRAIDTSPERLGFGACSSESHPVDVLDKLPFFTRIDGAEPFDPHAAQSTHEFYVGDKLAGRDPNWKSQDANVVIDRNGHIYLPEL